MAASTRILIGALVLLVVLLVGLGSVFVWRERSRPDDKKEFTSETVQKLYPGYFRNLTEQTTFEIAYFADFENQKPVNQTVVSSYQMCNIQCFGGNQFFRKRKSVSGTVYHGCCQSYIDFMTPMELPNLARIPRKIVQFELTKQYFLKHSCLALSSCRGCRCSQVQEIHTAVVLRLGVSEADDMDDVEIDFFKMDGCCRCINV